MRQGDSSGRRNCAVIRTQAWEGVKIDTSDCGTHSAFLRLPRLTSTRLDLAGCAIFTKSRVARKLRNFRFPNFREFSGRKSAVRTAPRLRLNSGALHKSFSVPSLFVMNWGCDEKTSMVGGSTSFRPEYRTYVAGVEAKFRGIDSLPDSFLSLRGLGSFPSAFARPHTALQGKCRSHAQDIDGSPFHIRQVRRGPFDQARRWGTNSRCYCPHVPENSIDESLERDSV